MPGTIPLFAVLAQVQAPLRSRGFPPRDPLMRLLNDPLVWGTVGALLGIYLFFRGFSLLKRKRLVFDTPCSTVRAAALGPVEISGQATGPYTLVSPLSRSDCYYYRVVMSLLRGNRKQRRTIEECAPFFVDDGTGVMLVDPHGAEIQIPPLSRQDAGSSPLPEYLCHFLLQHGIPKDDVVTVEEFCIAAQDRIVVFGTLQENPWSQPRPEAGESAARIGPGFLSETAADVQRRRAFQSLDPRAPSGVAPVSTREFDLYPPTILGKGSSPFFISNCSQRELVRSLGLQSALYIWGGPALALFYTYFLMQRLAGLWRR